MSVIEFLGDIDLYDVTWKINFKDFAIYAREFFINYLDFDFATSVTSNIAILVVLDSL